MYGEFKLLATRITKYGMPKHIQEMICITCPLGCRMELEIVDGELNTVQHNFCKRGVDYAKQGFYDPRRIVTATAAVTGSVVKRVPVRTDKPLPMKHIRKVLRAIYALKLAAPLDIGVSVINNVAGTNVDVITTRNIRKDL